MIFRVSLYRFYRTCILAGLAVILFSGCIPPGHYPHRSPPPHQPESPVVGGLHTEGPNVYYNRQPITGGHPVRSGDNVSTGENSRATVKLINGCVVTIDQNTDPDFLKEAWCILVTIYKGQVYTDGSGVCIETPHFNGLFNSKVNIVVTDHETIFTVLSGSVTMERPVHRTFKRRQQVRVSRRGIQSVRLLSGHQLKAVFQWHHLRPGRQREVRTVQCRRYAETAVSQQKENLRRRCRFKGSQWSSDFKYHYNWCLKAPKSTADAGNRARAEALKHKCAKSPHAKKEQQCRKYAEIAVSQQKENLRRRCRFKGSQWSSDSKYHYNWCLKAPKSTADAGNRARAEALKHKCAKSPHAKKERQCRCYAEIAVSQQKENLRRGCRLKGSPWSSDFDYHYNWCLKVPRSTSEAGTRARDNSLKKCRKHGPMIY